MTRSGTKSVLLSATILALALGVTGPTASEAWAALPFCHDADECGGGESCVGGICRPSCDDDGDCGGNTACLRGGCIERYTFPFASDFGLADEGWQPACEEDVDCSPTPRVACHQASQTCRQYLDVDMGTYEWRRCHQEEPGGGVNLLPGACLHVGGYECEADGDDSFCGGGECTQDSDCIDAFPITDPGLSCEGGRCTTDCTADADCCDSTGACPTRPQTTCVDIPQRPDGGVCGAAQRTAEIYPLWITEDDPTQATNIVLMSEGYRNDGELNTFDKFAVNAIQYMTTRFDLHNGIYRNGYNFFAVRFLDDAASYERETEFGWSKGAQNTSHPNAGTINHIKFVGRQGLARYAEAKGFTGATVWDDLGATQETTGTIFNASSGRARAGGGVIMVRLHDDEDPGGVPSNPDTVSNKYFVLGHELGHQYGTRDEYQSDAETRNTCELAAGDCTRRNLISRVFVNPSCANCSADPVVDQCDGDHDGTWMPAVANEPAWRDMMTVGIPGDLPTSSNDIDAVGLYNGGLNAYDTEIMRSQRDCVMRQGGIDFFCAACTQIAAHTTLRGTGGLVRLIVTDGCIQGPALTGLGPHRAVGVSRAGNVALFTRAFQGGSSELMVFDTRVLRQGHNVDITAELQGGETPARIFVDEGRRRAFMVSFHQDPEDNGFVVYDIDGGDLSRIDIPGLGSPFIIDEFDLLYAFRTEPGGGGVQGDLVRLDLAQASPDVVDLDLGPLPAMQSTPAWATDNGLLFYPVTREVPLKVQCGLTNCEIRTFNPGTEQFLDDPLVTDMTVEARGIRGIAVAHPDPMTSAAPSEVVIAATEREVYVWDVADVASGGVTPWAQWDHDVGTGADVLAMAYSRSTDTVWLGNTQGEIAAFDLAGADAPAGTPVAVAGVGPNMEVRELVSTADGTVYATLGGFSGPRDGLLLIIDPVAAAITTRQELVAVGFSPVTIAIDETRQLLFTTGIVDSGDRVFGSLEDNLCGNLGAGYRVPIFATPTFNYVSHGGGACGAW